MISEKEKGRRHIESMVKILASDFPTLSPVQINHLKNMITNALREAGGDMYLVEISPTPFQEEAGYFMFLTVQGCGTEVFVRITVD